MKQRSIPLPNGFRPLKRSFIHTALVTAAILATPAAVASNTVSWENIANDANTPKTCWVTALVPRPSVIAP